MNEHFNCSCRMKLDLERTEDVFSFFEENFPISGIVEKRRELSKDELRCASCLMGCALMRLSQKKTFWEGLKMKILGKR